MAGTVLLKDVLWGISDLLQDTSPQFTKWPERNLVRSHSDGQMAVDKYLPLAGPRVDAG